MKEGFVRIGGFNVKNVRIVLISMKWLISVMKWAVRNIGGILKLRLHVRLLLVRYVDFEILRLQLKWCGKINGYPVRRYYEIQSGCGHKTMDNEQTRENLQGRHELPQQGKLEQWKQTNNHGRFEGFSANVYMQSIKYDQRNDDLYSKSVI